VTSKQTPLVIVLLLVTHHLSLITCHSSLLYWRQTSGALRHTERLVTVASFRTWRGSRASVAQSPKPDIRICRGGELRAHEAQYNFKIVPCSALVSRLLVPCYAKTDGVSRNTCQIRLQFREHKPRLCHLLCERALPSRRAADMFSQSAKGRAFALSDAKTARFAPESREGSLDSSGSTGRRIGTTKITYLGRENP
jgi:hypothetical protein